MPAHARSSLLVAALGGLLLAAAWFSTPRGRGATPADTGLLLIVAAGFAACIVPA